MAVIISPYGYPTSQFSPLARQPTAGMPVLDGQQINAATLGDLSPDDDLLMTVSSRALTANLRRLRCRVSLVLLEPPAIQGRYYRLLAHLGTRYHRLFTYSEQLVERLPNAVLLHLGGSSIAPPNTAQPQKSQRVSLLASQKTTTEGHRLRHRVAAWAMSSSTGLELFGRAYRPVDQVTTALLPFCYSVVIENSRFANYFTEKLIDCLLCRTIPIYWGDPRAASRFNSRGIICCQSEAEIREAILTCNQAEYESRRDAVEENYQRALHFAVSPALRAAHHLNADALPAPTDRWCPSGGTTPPAVAANPAFTQDLQAA